jgi:hypothetical protein
MTPMSERLAGVIAAERAACEPPPGAKERHWAAISAGLGGPGGDEPPGGGEPGPANSGPSGSIGSSGSTPAAASPSLGLAAKATLAMAATLVTAAIIVAVASDDAGQAVVAPVVAASEPVDGGSDRNTVEPHVAGPRSGAAARVRDEVSEATVSPATPSRVSDPHRGRTRSTRRPASPPPVPAAEDETAQGLRAELVIIDDAERALRQKRFDAVLKLTARHRARFPEGELTAERLDLEAAAHCALGDLERGRRRLAELRHGWPRSPVSAITKQTCEAPTDPRGAGNEGMR